MNENLIVLNYLATGIKHLIERLNQGKGIYPYPEELQIALNKVAAMFIEKDLKPPSNVVDLLELARQSIDKWGIFEDDDLKKLNPDSILKGNIITDFGSELVYLNNDIAAEFEQSLIKEVLNICRVKNDQDAYVLFRKRIIQHPYLTVDNLYEYQNDPDMEIVKEQFKSAYEEIPAAAVKNSCGNYLACGYCNWILEENLDGSYHCIKEYCAEVTENFKVYHEVKESLIYRLKEGIMRYIAYPGKAELELERELKKIKEVKVELWPEFDSYDLKITFLSGKFWAVDVKDWYSPSLLAKYAKSFINGDGWEKAFYVIPDYQVKRSKRYIGIFKEEWNALNSDQKGIHFMKMSDFIKMVKGAI